MVAVADMLDVSGKSVAVVAAVAVVVGGAMRCLRLLALKDLDLVLLNLAEMFRSWPYHEPKTPCYRSRHSCSLTHKPWKCLQSAREPAPRPLSELLGSERAS